MTPRLLADLVLVAHLAFIGFVAFGGLLALRWRWIPALQLPAAAWGMYVELAGVLCPLTPLENGLRRAAGESGYSGGFVEHYLVPVIYPASLSGSVQLALAGAVVVLNAAAYLVVWRLAGRPERRSD